MKFKIFLLIFFIVVILVGFIYYFSNYGYKNANLDEPMDGIYAKFYEDGTSNSHILILYNDDNYLSVIKSNFEAYTEKGKWVREENILKLNPFMENVTSIEFEIINNDLKILNSDSSEEIILHRITAGG